MWWERAQPFDLVMTWPRMENHDLVTFFISGGISLFTGGGPSHVMIFFKNKFVWEVTYPKPRFAGVQHWNLDDYDIELGYHLAFAEGVPEPQAKAMKKRMFEVIRSGSHYDVEELAWHLLDELGIYSHDNSDPERFVCSSGAEAVYRAAGYGFRPKEELVSPQDIRMSPVYVTRWRSWEAETKCA